MDDNKANLMDEVKQVKHKTIKLWQGAVLIFVVSMIVFTGGMYFGNIFFWNQFDKTPLLERQYQNALQKVKTNPNDSSAHVQLGWALFQKGRYNDALAEYKKATDLDPESFQAYYNLGLAYRQVGKNELAVSTLQKALEYNPKSFEVHFDLGIVYQTLGKYEEALRELKLAYRLHPGSTAIIYCIGETYEKMGNVEEAVYQYRTALDFDPKFDKSIEALKRLGGGL